MQSPATMHAFYMRSGSAAPDATAPTLVPALARAVECALGGLGFALLEELVVLCGQVVTIADYGRLGTGIGISVWISFWVSARG
jgi:hypothetical protein